MPARNVVLAACAVILVGGVLLLMMKVKASPKNTVSEAELARAKAAHTRGNKGSSARSAPRGTFNPGPVTRRRPKRDKDTRAARDRRKPPFDSPGGYVGTTDRPTPRSTINRLKARVNTDNKPASGLKMLMDKANKSYDSGDYEGAQKRALDILKENPNNIRMLRIAVSTACIMGDGDEARKWAKHLPARDRGQLSRRCKRYQVDL